MKKSNVGFKKEYEAVAGYSGDFLLADYRRNAAANKTFYSFIENAVKGLRGKILRIMEVGSGTGRNACYLAKKYPKVEVHALDILKESLIAGRRTAALLKCGANLKFVVADATKLKYKDGYFDLIYSQGTLEHFKDINPVMKEQVRVLKPGGILIINVPQTFNYYTIKKHLAMARGKWEPGWETQYSYGDLKNIERTFGLQLIKVGGQEYDSKLTEVVKAYGFLSKSLIPKALDRIFRSGWAKLKENFGHLFLLEIIGVFKKV